MREEQDILNVQGAMCKVLLALFSNKLTGTLTFSTGE